MVFFGEYTVSFTAPGRIVLPKKVRELLKGSTFVITKGFDACLSGFDRRDWEKRAKELMSVSLLERDNIEKRRFLFASAVYVEIDDQGRFVIPKHLLQYSQLKEKVVIAGIGDHFEMWSPQRWQKYLETINN